MANTDPLEVQLLDTDLITKITLLPADGTNLYLQLNEPGSGACRIPVSSAAAAQIVKGQFVRVNYRGANRGGFFVENTRQTDASQGEGGDRWLQISGRGALAILEEAVIWHDGTSNTTRTFTAQKKAAILKTLIDEAQARGALSILTYDFTGTVDSNAVAWTDSETMELNVGMTLLELVRQIAALGIDFDIELEAGGTFTLHAYKNGKGTDKSNTIYFRVGSNCEDANQADLASQLHNAYLVKYGAGYTYTSDATSISTYRRREKLYHADETNNPNTALSFANVDKNNEKDPQSALYLKIYDGISPLAFVDYDLGDTVSTDRHGTEIDYRIRGMQLSWIGDRQYADVVVTNNTTILENQLKISREVERLKRLLTQAHDANLVEVAYWAAIGGTATDGIVKSFYLDGDYLYVGGEFDRIGGSPGVAGTDARNIARYHIPTGTWSPVGDGFVSVTGGGVYSIVKIGSDFYFGGAFHTTGGIDHLAKWDGSTMTAITGVDSAGIIYDMAAIGTDLYIGGTLDIGVGMAVLAKYDTVGEAFSSVGFAGGTPKSMTVNGTTLYVGDNSGKVQSYNGAAWTELADFDDTVSALMYFNSLLYAAGQFTDGLKSWNGVVWSTVGGGLGAVGIYDTGFALANDGVNIVVGFDGTTAGGVTVNYIGLYNGSNWVILDQGVNAAVYTILCNNNTIYTGGRFTQVSGKDIPYIAAYIQTFDELLNFLEHNTQVDWGQIGGDIDDQLDLIARLALKQNIAGNPANSILITDASGNITTDEKFLWKTATRTLIQGSATALFDAVADTYNIVADGSFNFNKEIYSDTLTVSESDVSIRGGGTQALPTRAKSGMYVKRWRARGLSKDDDTAGGQTVTNTLAEIRAVATANWSLTSQPIKLEFYTTPVGAVTEVLGMTLTDAGILTINNNPVIGGFAINFPATGTVPLLATANVFTAAQTITPSADVVGLTINKSATADFLQLKSGATALARVNASGHWGIGTAPATEYQFYILGASAAANDAGIKSYYTATHTGAASLYFEEYIRNTSGAISANAVRGFIYPFMTGTGTVTSCTAFFGIVNQISANAVLEANGAKTYILLDANKGTVTRGNNYECLLNNSAGTTLTTWVAYSIGSITNAGTLGTAYGLLFPDITVGGTNYALSTGKGLNKLGDQLTITGWQDVNQLIVTGFTTQTNPVAHLIDNTAETAAIRNVLQLEARSTGTVAANFGVGLPFYAETATNGTYQQQGLISTSWIDATNATRKAKLSLSAYDTAARLGLEIEASGTAAKLAFYGGTTVVRGAALTAQLTSITHAAPGTPDYAVQDFVDISLGAGWAFASHDEANTVLSVILNLQTRVAELEARLGSATGVNLFA